MKFIVTMKDPDAIYESIRDAVVAEVAKLPLSAAEKAVIAEGRTENVTEMCAKWFRYSELLTVEIDTEDETCTVVPQ